MSLCCIFCLLEFMIMTFYIFKSCVGLSRRQVKHSANTLEKGDRLPQNHVKDFDKPSKQLLMKKSELLSSSNFRIFLFNCIFQIFRTFKERSQFCVDTAHNKSSSRLQNIRQQLTEKNQLLVALDCQCHLNHLGILLKCRFQIQMIWSLSGKSAFLICSG